MKSFLTFIFVLFFLQIYGQSNFYSWNRLCLKIILKERIFSSHEVDDRYSLDGLFRSQFITHHRIHFTTISDNIHGIGFAYSYINEENFDDQQQARIYYDYEIFRKKKRVTFNTRFRLENIFFEAYALGDLKNDKSYLLRLRLKPEFIFHISKSLELSAGNELFYNVEGQSPDFFQNNRLYLGCSYMFSPRMKLAFNPILVSAAKQHSFVFRTSLFFTVGD